MVKIKKLNVQNKNYLYTSLFSRISFINFRKYLFVNFCNAKMYYFPICTIKHYALNKKTLYQHVRFSSTLYFIIIIKHGINMDDLKFLMFIHCIVNNVVKYFSGIFFLGILIIQNIYIFYRYTSKAI